IAAAAARPLPASRTASTTRAPATASACAVARPMPLLAPVTITVRLVISGMFAALKVVMSNNVGAANKDVNAYIWRYRVRHGRSSLPSRQPPRRAAGPGRAHAPPAGEREAIAA